MTEDNEHLLKNTVAKEREKVSEVVKKLGLRLSGLMIACGLLVAAFGFYLIFTPPDPVLSPRLSLVFVGSLGFIGGLNILCGLLLLLGED